MTSLPAELKCKLASLPQEGAKLSRERGATIQKTISKAKIQKVQPYLRQRPEHEKYYSPKLVSIGPIHHHTDDGKINLVQGEKYKKIWASKYIGDMGTQTAEQLLLEIRSAIKTLRGFFYSEDAIQGCDDDEKLAWILFTDGCAVLHFLDKASFKSTDAIGIKVDQQVIVLQDLMLLENQLPFHVLKLLSKDDAKLHHCITNFLYLHHMTPIMNIDDKLDWEHELRITMDEPTHLLDLLRRSILPVDEQEMENNQKSLIYRFWNLLRGTIPSGHEISQDEQKATKNLWLRLTYRNMQELKASGIRIKKNDNASLTQISFSCGKLYLSKLIVDDLTAPTFLNMMAYEMCPDFNNTYDISSYVSFLNALIDVPDDVKELRRVGVLHNLLGSDEEVAKFFNTVSADCVLDSKRYLRVREGIEKHYQNRCLTWLAEAYHNHFNSPWSFIGLLAAVTALLLTFVQTWLAIHPVPNGR